MELVCSNALDKIKQNTNFQNDKNITLQNSPFIESYFQNNCYLKELQGRHNKSKIRVQSIWANIKSVKALEFLLKSMGAIAPITLLNNSLESYEKSLSSQTVISYGGRIKLAPLANKWYDDAGTSKFKDQFWFFCFQTTLLL